MDVKKQTKLVEFLTETPGSDRKAIEKGTKIKGALLTNLFKRLEENGILSVAGEGAEKKYSIKTKQKKEEKVEAAPADKGENNQEAATTEKAEKVEKKATGSRDNRKFKFDGQEYGKGPLVRAVVENYAKKNPKTTIAQLKKVFPDELLHRYGIFQEIKDAKKLSGNRDRYFMKPEQIIKVKDGTVAVCNQFTAENIQPFLKVAKEQGFIIK